MVALMEPARGDRVKEVERLQLGEPKDRVRDIVINQMIAGTIGAGREVIWWLSQPGDRWTTELRAMRLCALAGLRFECIGVENSPKMIRAVAANKPVFAQLRYDHYGEVLFSTLGTISVAGMREAEKALYGPEVLGCTNMFDDGMGEPTKEMLDRTVATLNRIVLGGTVHLTFVPRMRHKSNQRKITDLLGEGLIGRENRWSLMDAFAHRVQESTKPGIRYTAALQYVGGYNTPMAVLGFSNGVDIPVVRMKLSKKGTEVESDAA